MKTQIIFMIILSLMVFSCKKKDNSEDEKTKYELLSMKSHKKRSKSVKKAGYPAKPKDRMKNIYKNMPGSNKVYSKSQMGSGGIGIGGGGGLGGRFGRMGGIGYRRRTLSRRKLRPRSGFDLKRNNKNFNTEKYDHQQENSFELVKNKPLSTFSIDVDTASYANMRRFLKSGTKPPAGAIRIEEMINYFTYDYRAPDKNSTKPFAVNAELTNCPWKKDHKLFRVGIKGKIIEKQNRKRSNLVFLLDVSGSMSSSNKLPLLKTAFGKLLANLNGKDKVSIVVYAGASGIALQPTNADNKDTILKSLNSLRSGGSTNGGAGIQLAYKLAQENFIKGGVNRVFLATDGDFNVGVSSRSELVKLIKEKAKSNIFLTVLGFGMGNYSDALLEQISGKGNGNYYYIDTANEAQKVLSTQLAGTLITIAKDVKIQVEFNPARVKAYRLIGYENRMLAAKDFNDDKKDAGEIGAGHSVTALYDLVPPGVKINAGNIDKLKYQKPATITKTGAISKELATVKIRYKKPTGTKSILLSYNVKDKVTDFFNSSKNMRFASAVAGFGMLLKDSKLKGDLNYEKVINIAKNAIGKDKFGYRKEFISLVKKANDSKSYGNPNNYATTRRMHMPYVKFGKASLVGSMDINEVKTVIRAHRREVYHCYQKGLMAKQDLKGKVKVSFKINKKGRVNSCKVKKNLSIAKVGTCICGRLLTWRFPEPSNKRSATVIFSWTLQP